MKPKNVYVTVALIYLCVGGNELSGNVSWPAWRKTEEQRRQTHQTIYGKDAVLPERQYRYAPWGRYPNQSLTNTDWKPLAVLGGILFVLWFVGRK